MNTTYQYPFVSIITVNYNQAKVTAEWLQSVRNITYPAYEIIIVDNASTQNVLEDYIQDWENVQLIRSKENKGFASGNNAGVEKAKGEFLMFLNNDTEVEKGFLEPLINCVQSNSNIGMVSPKIKYFYEQDLIQYAGGNKINAFTGRGNFIGNKKKDGPSYNATKCTELIHGSAMLVSRTLIDKVGLMDESYFLYYEELDWCERAKKAGFKVYIVGQSVIYHKESISVGKNSPLRMYYITRNRILFMQRNFTCFSYLTYLLYFIIISIPKNIIKFLWQGRVDLLQAFIKGFAWHISSKYVTLKSNTTALVPVRLRTTHIEHS